MFVLMFAESGGVQIVPDLSIFVHMAMILVMIWILNRTFFKPINKVLTARDQSGGRETASQEMLTEAAEKEKKYKDELLEARNEGYQLIESERSSAVEARQERVASAKAEIRSSTDGKLRELEAKTAEAKAKIDEEAVALADKITSNIVKAG